MNTKTTTAVDLTTNGVTISKKFLHNILGCMQENDYSAVFSPLVLHKPFFLFKWSVSHIKTFFYLTVKCWNSEKNYLYIDAHFLLASCSCTGYIFIVPCVVLDTRDNKFIYKIKYPGIKQKSNCFSFTCIWWWKYTLH